MMLRCRAALLLATVVAVALLAALPVRRTTAAGHTAIVTTEFNKIWMIDRARFYFASEIPLPRHRAALP
jgi:hypothetical protein